jgi:Methyltransferase domain
MISFLNKSDFETYRLCVEEYNKDKDLMNLREFVKNNNYGFCDDAHYVMWRELVKEMPKKFNFLEIGVYKGQILCLISYLSKIYKKESNVLGVTPLQNIGDKYSTYPSIDYSESIIELFKKFDLDFNLDKNILNGLSTNQEVIDSLIKKEKFNLIYIDGGHDYETVVSDIELTKKILNVNGYIITDDSSCYKNFEGLPIFTGHIEVCDAIKDYLEPDTNFKEKLCVGHNRVFKKIK